MDQEFQELVDLSDIKDPTLLNTAILKFKQHLPQKELFALYFEKVTQQLLKAATDQTIPLIVELALYLVEQPKDVSHLDNFFATEAGIQRINEATGADGVLQAMMRIHPVEKRVVFIQTLKLASFMVADNDIIKRAFRKKGLIKSLIKLAKDLTVNQKDIDVLTSLMHFFGSYLSGRSSKKEVQYFTVKGGLSITTSLLSIGIIDVKEACLLVIAECAQQGPSSSSLVISIIEFVKESLVNNKGAQQGMYALLSLSGQNEEVISASGFHQFIVVPIMTEYSEDAVLVGLAVAVIRRLITPKTKDQIAEMYLLTLATIIEMNADNPPTDNHSTFLLKECIATLGVLASDPANREALASNTVSHVLAIAKANMGHAKLLKTSLGCLINIASTQSLARDPNFYQILYTVLDQYCESKPMIDYILRLILNSIQSNQISLQNYLSGCLLHKLFSFIPQHGNNSEITKMSLQVIRVLVTEMDTTSLAEQVQDKTQLKGEAIIAMFLDLWKVISPSDTTVQIFKESVLLLAYLCQHSATYESILKKTPEIAVSLQTFIESVKKNDKHLLVVTDCIAYLPIEDL